MGSTETASTLTPRLFHSSSRAATRPSSVVQTGVKSAGWLKRTAQLASFQSWKRIGPSVVVASKSGRSRPVAVLPLARPLAVGRTARPGLHAILTTEPCITLWVSKCCDAHPVDSQPTHRDCAWNLSPSIGAPDVSALLDTITTQVLHAPVWLVLLVVGGIVFVEDALFVGFVVPGETVAILGGVAASLGHVPLAAVLVVVVVAA